MKKVILSALALAVSALTYGQGFFEQVPFRGAMGTTDWSASWANWNPGATVYPGDPNGPTTNIVNVSGDITTNTTWSAGNTYVCTGLVRVRSGATLTIEPGVVVRGTTSTNANDKFALIIAKGAKINAQGTAAQPIVFTSGQPAGSRVPGDWAGILLVGNGITNLRNQPGIPDGQGQYEALPTESEARYGGSDNNDNSGVLKYVRIEYAGFNYLPNQELNGLTFAAVGAGTQVDYVQVSYANDDAFEWFGGAVNAKHLISLATIDDDFDCDEGFQGKVQFGVIARHPGYSDLAGSSMGLEHDNNTGRNANAGTGKVPNVDNPLPVTMPTFSNITIVGPVRQGEAVADLPSTQRFQNGVLLRTNASTSLFNSIIGGWPVSAINLGHGAASIVPSTHLKALADSITMQGVSATSVANVFAQGNVPASATIGGNPFTTQAWFTATTSNSTEANIGGFGITQPAYTGTANGAVSQISFATVNYALTAASAYNTGATFTHPKLANFILSQTKGNLRNTQVHSFGREVFVKTTHLNDVVHTLHVVDVMGRVVYTHHNSVEDINFSFTVNVPAGVYLVKGIGRNGEITTRVYLGE